MTSLINGILEKKAPEKHVVGYYDASVGHGGTTRYLMELVGGLDRTRFQPIFFALKPRKWHDDLARQGVDVITLPERALTKKEKSEQNITGRDTKINAGAALETNIGQASASSWEPVVTPGFRRPALRPRLPRSIAWSAGQLRDCLELARLFRLRPIDLLHTNETGSELSPIAARLAGVRRILGTWHVDSTSDLANERQGLSYRLLESASMRALHGAIAVSAATSRAWIQRCRLSAAYQQRIAVIHNGIALPDASTPEQHAREREAHRAEFGIPVDAVVAGSLGRLAAAKGYTYLIDAIADAGTQIPNLWLLLAGAGPEELALKSQAEKCGLTDRIVFAGFVQDTRRVLSCMDIYAQPSLCETLGIAAIEASAMELPIVASHIGGLPEVVEDGVTGTLVPARDSAALSKAIVALGLNPQKRAAMGRQGRQRINSCFQRDKMVLKTTEVYIRMLEA